MKKLFLTILTCLVVTSLYAGQLCDAIVTKGGAQIQCVISNVGDDEIQYRDCSNSNSEVNTISVTELRKIYLADGTIMDYTKGGTPIITKAAKTIEKQESTASQVSKEKVKEVSVQSAPTPDKIDIIITIDAQKIEAKIIEVSKNEIKYKEIDNLDGPTFVLSTQEINSIIYANGKVSVYKKQEYSEHKEETTPQTITTTISEEPDKKVEYDLARVANYSGVYVFTDCTPLAEYEVIGDVYYDKAGEEHTSVLPTYGVSPSGRMQIVGMHELTLTDTPQYPDIRDGLIVMAVLANRAVEGIIITLPEYGKGRATLIKFKEGTADRPLAKANSHLGAYVFTDCTPVNTYDFLAKIEKVKKASLFYNDMRDKIIQTAQKKYPEVKGVIIHTVSGQYDTAEAIKF